MNYELQESKHARKWVKRSAANLFRFISIQINQRHLIIHLIDPCPS